MDFIDDCTKGNSTLKEMNVAPQNSFLRRPYDVTRDCSCGCEFGAVVVAVIRSIAKYVHTVCVNEHTHTGAKKPSKLC